MTAKSLVGEQTLDPALSNRKQLDPGSSSRKWRTLAASLYPGSSWLTVTGFVFLADIALSVAGLVLDPTQVMGAPAWMKPLKFGISTSLFAFTVAFIIGRMKRLRRFGQFVGCVLSIGLLLEIVLIDLQAARHTSSHFNVSTNFDARVYMTMGATIAIIFLSTFVLFVATCIERFQDRALGWAIRLSLLIALAGMSVGSLMTLPTPQQLAAIQPGVRPTHFGAHTVGAPDGGKSMPVTGWSADHGDLRIAHFIGLHAMQLLLLGWFMTADRAAWTKRLQLRLVLSLAFISLGAFAAMLWQALRGQPLLRPDAITLETWAVLLAMAIGALIWSGVMGARVSPQGEELA